VAATARSGRLLTQRIALAVTAFNNAIVGVWAGISPRSFYDHFPGLGHHWVSADGPYNEHLVRDVAALSLAVTLVVVAALWARSDAYVRIGSVAALVFSVPHTAYHFEHLDTLPKGDRVMLAASLLVTVVAPAIALITAWPRNASEPVSRP